MIDCLRRDHISAYGRARPTSPFLDALATKGTLFTDAYSTASWTKPAIASVLTGLYPHRHRVVDAGDRIAPSLPVLGERLRARGYANLFMNGGNVHISNRFGFDRGFDEYGYVWPRNAHQLTATFIAALAKIPTERPIFAYVHYMDLHLPFTSNPFNTFFSSACGGVRSDLLSRKITMKRIRGLTAVGELTEADKCDITDLYDGQIRYLDAQLEVLMGELKRSGRWDRTVLIVTADHGEEFWEHGNFEHGHSLYNELVAVPLVMVGPGIPAARVDTPVSLTDLHATILALAGLPLPVDSDARDLAGLSRQQPPSLRERPLALMGTLYGVERVALIDGDTKAILNAGARSDAWPLIGPSSTAQLEIYRLDTDPHEGSNLATSDPRLAANWRRRLELMLESPAAPDPNEQTLDREGREQLRSLGYLE